MNGGSVRASVPAAFTLFSASELDELRLYHDLVADLDAFDLATPQEITFEIGEYGALVDGPERQKFVALFTGFRKLGWSNEEGTFGRMRNLLAKHAHEAGTPEAETVQGALSKLKEMRADALKASPVASYELEHEDGSTEVLTPEYLIDVMINGVIFHTDSELAARWKQFGGWENPAISMIVITSLQELIKVFGLLDQIVGEVLDCPVLHDLD